MHRIGQCPWPQAPRPASTVPQPPDPGGFLGLSQQPGWVWFPQQPRSLLILAQLFWITMASFRPMGMGRSRLAIGVNEKLVFPHTMIRPHRPRWSPQSRMWSLVENLNPSLAQAAAIQGLRLWMLSAVTPSGIRMIRLPGSP